MFGGRKTLTGYSMRKAVDAATRGGAVAHFPCGDVLGVTVDGLSVYRGIPYALPPVGHRRWRRPEPVVPWHGVRDAIASGPACVQPSRRVGSIYDRPLAATSEDCLYLDIWAPEGARDLPVLVWIHGGSFVWGAGSDPLYDGAALARRGAVVVSINYRLGIFGYLAHPELSAESPDGVSGNYGLLDQIAALAWVRDNIAAVGGDPANVTVAGESAGALSVLYLLASPGARGLFAKAIAQSAYMISMPALRERRHGHVPAEVAGEGLAKSLGARNVGALRAMDAEDLADAALRAGFTPLGTIDGHLLPAQLVDVFERGHQAKVPLIAGFNGGEIRSLPFLIPTLPQAGKEYEEEIRRRYGSLAERFLALYGPGNLRESALASIRDALYGWTALKLAEAQKGIGAPAFVYLFDHSYPAASEAGLDAFHGCELTYLFGTADHTPPLWPAVPATKTEAALSRAMGDYWISFASAAAPTPEDWPDWPDHTITGRHMYFADVPGVETDLMPGMFALADEVVRQRRNAGDVPWNWNVGVAAPLPDADTR